METVKSISPFINPVHDEFIIDDVAIIEHPILVVKISFADHPDVPEHLTLHSYIVLGFNVSIVVGDVTFVCPELEGIHEPPCSLYLNL